MSSLNYGPARVRVRQLSPEMGLATTLRDQARDSGWGSLMVRLGVFAAIGLLVSGGAAAQAIEVVEAAPTADLGGMLATGLVALIAFVLLAWLRRRLNREILRADHFLSQTTRLEAFVAASPLPYCGWSSGGAMAASEDLSSVLGAAEIERFEDIEIALSPSDAAALNGLFARLRSDGEPFTLTAAVADDTRRVRIAGRRGRALHDDEFFDVLWFDDVTKAEAQREALTRKLATGARFQGELAAMLDMLPIPVWLRRPDDRLGWVNRAYASALEIDQPEVIDRQIELGHSVVELDGKALAQSARRLSRSQSESHHVVVDGERRLLSFTEIPVQASREQLDATGLVIGFCVDITELEETRTELARHIAAHDEVLERLKTAIAIFGPDKRLVFYNQSYHHLWGLEEIWLDGGPTYGEVLEDLRTRRRLPETADFRAFKAEQLNLFTELLSPTEELRHLPDGTTLREVVTPHPFGGLLFVQEDVTDALALERNFNTLMAVQLETLDNLSEGIMVVGSDGRLRLTNPAFSRLLELEETDLSHQPHVSQVVAAMQRQFSDPDTWASARETMIDRALEREQQDHVFELANGTVVEFSAIPLPDGGVLMTFVDITDTAKVEQALRLTNEALEAADRLKTEFLANVSYQLRTPLSTIMGFAEMLGDEYFGPLNDRQRDNVQSIETASQRLLALINDILDLASIEAGQLELHRQTVDLAALIKGVASMVTDSANPQALRLEINLHPDLAPIEADEQRLRQALLNLVSNASKYNRSGGTINLSAEPRTDDQLGPVVDISVADTGVGIPSRDLDRVFHRFEKGLDRSGSGAGLGLSLVKSYIELHGGRVELSSRVNEGTTVTCRIPIVGPKFESQTPVF